MPDTMTPAPLGLITHQPSLQHSISTTQANQHELTDTGTPHDTHSGRGAVLCCRQLIILAATSQGMLGVERKTRKTSSQKGAAGQGSNQASSFRLGACIATAESVCHRHSHSSAMLYHFSIHLELTNCLRFMPRCNACTMPCPRASTHS